MVVMVVMVVTKEQETVLKEQVMVVKEQANETDGADGGSWISSGNNFNKMEDGGVWSPAPLLDMLSTAFESSCNEKLSLSGV